MSSNITPTTPKIGLFLILILIANVFLSLYLGYEVYDVKRTLNYDRGKPSIVSGSSENNIGRYRRKSETEFSDSNLQIDYGACKTGQPCYKEKNTSQPEVISNEFSEYVKSLWDKNLISYDPGKGPFAKPAIHLERSSRTKEELTFCDEESSSFRHSAIKHMQVVTVDQNKFLEFNQTSGRVNIKIPGYYYVYSQVEYQLSKKVKKRLEKKLLKGKLKEYDLRDGHVICKGKHVLLESYFSPFDVHTSSFISTTLTDFNGGIFLFQKGDTIWIINLGPISVNDRQVYFGAFYFDFPHQQIKEAEQIETPTRGCNLEKHTIFFERNLTMDGKNEKYACFSKYPISRCPHHCDTKTVKVEVGFHCLPKDDKNVNKYKKNKRLYLRNEKTTIVDEIPIPIHCSQFNNNNNNNIFNANPT